MFKLLIRLFCTILAAAALFIIIERAQLSLYALQRHDPLPHAQMLFNAERYAEADAWLDFFVTFDYVRDNPQIKQLHHDIKDIRSGILYQSKKTIGGFFTGKSDETGGQIGAVVSDFLVVGDLRDLAVEGWHYAQDEEVDEVVVALSAIGVAATGAQLASAVGTAASAGAASPTLVGSTTAKAAIVMLKTAKRLGKLPGWLIKEIKIAAKNIKQHKTMGMLEDLFDDLYTLSLTPGGLELLSHSKDAAGLRKMANFSKHFNKESAILHHLAGDDIVEAAQHLKHHDELQALRLAGTYGDEGVQALKRVGAKNFAKNTAKKAHKYKVLYKHLPTWLLKFLAALPLWLLSGLVVLGVLVWWPYARKWSARLAK